MNRNDMLEEIKDDLILKRDSILSSDFKDIIVSMISLIEVLQDEDLEATNEST